MVFTIDLVPVLFRCRQIKEINTRIILFNYFLLKNKNQVAICVTLRDKEGCFIDRKNIDFQDQSVIILDKDFWVLDNHLGSVEVEYFSLKNLVIPYAAVIGAYETKLELVIYTLTQGAIQNMN